MEKIRCTVKSLAPVLAVVFLCALLSRPAAANEQATDEEKRQRMEALYQDYKKVFPKVPEMTAEEALELSAQDKFILVDIREPEEQSVSMLPGAITEEEFLGNPDAYGEHLIIGYCTNGYRSGVLAKQLKEKMDIQMVNLAAGILAWLHAGGKVYHEGEPVNRVHVYGKKWDLAPSDYETVW